MAIYEISYDLNKTGKDYKGLYAAIEFFTYFHPLDSTWFVDTDWSAHQIWLRLKPHLDNDDKLLINEVTKNYYADLPSGLENWLRYRLG